MIHQQGYGSRNLDDDQPVTPESLFAIGSCTKAFTAMALALLVEDGDLEWDRPIRDYMPQFKLHDAVASQQMTARDLLCHRSGLPRHDAMWYGSSQFALGTIRPAATSATECAVPLCLSVSKSDVHDRRLSSGGHYG